MFHRTESIDDIGLSRILQTDKSNTISSLTKVICTIGVKSRTVEELSKLLEAGMSVARFDFSWGSHKYHTETLMNLRQAMKNTKILCATMLDTFGSEVAVRLAAEDVSSFDKDAPKTPLEMKKGNKVVLSVCNDREDQKKMVATSESQRPRCFTISAPASPRSAASTACSRRISSSRTRRRAASC